jgi:hypothetical protein
MWEKLQLKIIYEWWSNIARGLHDTQVNWKHSSNLTKNKCSINNHYGPDDNLSHEKKVRKKWKFIDALFSSRQQQQNSSQTDIQEEGGKKKTIYLLCQFFW